MTEAEIIIAGIALLQRMVQNQLDLAKAKAAAAATSTTERDAILAAVNSLHQSNAQLNDEWNTP